MTMTALDLSNIRMAHLVLTAMAEKRGLDATIETAGEDKHTPYCGAKMYLKASTGLGYYDVLDLYLCDDDNDGCWMVSVMTDGGEMKLLEPLDTDAVVINKAIDLLIRCSDRSGCSFLFPSDEAVKQAKRERADAYNKAHSEDEALAAAESSFRDYLPPCTCFHCGGEA